MTPMDEIRVLLENNITGSIVEVSDMTGTMDHLEIMIASDVFKGKMLIDQHQIVMDILKEPLKDQVHAVKIKTVTLEKYNTLNNKEA